MSNAFALSTFTEKLPEIEGLAISIDEPEPGAAILNATM
jgi:hypothetical protein